MIKFLLWIGIVARNDKGGIDWPVHVAPRWVWLFVLRHPIKASQLTGWVYLFRNLPHVIKWKDGRLLPRRWGFGILGLVEFGDRGH